MHIYAYIYIYIYICNFTLVTDTDMRRLQQVVAFLHNKVVYMDCRTGPFALVQPPVALILAICHPVDSNRLSLLNELVVLIK